jgi:K+-transporting ATPase KdpF subunit
MSAPPCSSSPFAWLTPNGASGFKEFMGTIIVGIISLALLIYLFIAMIWPEKF